jgi:hypothetical protein
MRLLRNSVLGALVVAAILAPHAVRADDRVPIDGTFAVTFTYPAAFACTGGGVPIEAQGIGQMLGLGSLFFKVTKCLSFPDGAVGAYAGTFTMVAGNRDTLTGTYAGTQDFTQVDANGFGPFQGTLTFTGGTGRFAQAAGTLRFTAIASPTSTSLSLSGSQDGMAYYLVQGNMLSPEQH